LVATPGRLYKLIKENIEYGKCESLNLLNHVQFIALDECDKLGQKCYLTDTVKILNEVYLQESRTTFKLDLSGKLDDVNATEENTIVDVNDLLVQELRTHNQVVDMKKSNVHK